MTTPPPPIAFLFPGQGSQAVGMGKELAEKYPIARQTFEEADEALGDMLGKKLSQLCFEGPEEKLRMTEITQPAILTASVAAWRVLNEKGLTPASWPDTAWANTRLTLQPEQSLSQTPFAPYAIVESTCRKLFPWASAPWRRFSEWTWKKSQPCAAMHLRAKFVSRQTSIRRSRL